MPPSSQRIFSERIPPTPLSAVVDALSHDDAKKKVQEVIDNYVGLVVFEELVMKYAGKEIERRSLGTFRFWTMIISSAVITGLITTLITLALTHKP